MKLSSAQSTFATRKPVREQEKEQSLRQRTSVGDEHARRATHRAVGVAAFLHLDQAPDTEEMPAGEAYGLERDAGADEALVVVQRRDYGEQRRAELLHQDPRK
jgi:hypothetical protein